MALQGGEASDAATVLAGLERDRQRSHSLAALKSSSVERERRQGHDRKLSLDIEVDQVVATSEPRRCGQIYLQLGQAL